MEIIATPQRPAWWAPLGRVVVTVALLLAVGLLVPASLGLQRQVVTTDDGGTYARGWLVLSDRVSVEELAVGDVVVGEVPGARGTPGLAARVVVAHGQDTRVSGGALAPGRWEGARQQRVAFAVPLLGYPVLVWKTVAALLGSLLLLLGGIRFALRSGRRRSGDQRPGGRYPRSAELPSMADATTAAG